jgi:magnesium transporter
MIQTLAAQDQHGYTWTDLISSDEAELQELSERNGLLDQSVRDSFQADHLPKYERLKKYTFSILRVYSPDMNVEADTVRDVTDKVSLFIGDSFIISVHRNQWPALKIISQQVQAGDCPSTQHVYIEIVRAALLSFEEPGGKLASDIEYFEKNIFLKDRRKPFLKGLYFVKRKVDVIRRILLLFYEIIDRLDPAGESTPASRDVRDLYIKQQSVFDSLSENTNHLLNIYFNIAAQKTNETIRILTIFSVFFLPLTFIVGVYGMNFQFMPELGWRFGYPGVFLLMAVVTVSIYIWFKRKKWL